MLRATMVNRLLSPSRLLACFAIVVGLFFATPSSSSGVRETRGHSALHVSRQDTGHTVALSVGQEMVVTVPLRPYRDNHWYVAENSGGALKLIARPDEKRKRNWEPGKPSQVVFYFRRESPGTAHLVLEPGNGERPMLLEVVDR